MTIKRRLSKLEASAKPAAAWRMLQKKYSLPDPSPGLTEAGKYLELVHRLRHRVVLEHFAPQLLRRLDPELMLILNDASLKATRLWHAVVATIDNHVMPAAPLELPLEVVQIYLIHPTNLDDPEYPQGQHIAGRALSGVDYDCESCGYRYPTLDNKRLAAGTKNTWLWGVISPITQCLLCGGHVGSMAYWDKHKRCVSGRRTIRYPALERLPEVEYPPEAWEEQSLIRA